MSEATGWKRQLHMCLYWRCSFKYWNPDRTINKPTKTARKSWDPIRGMHCHWEKVAGETQNRTLLSEDQQSSCNWQEKKPNLIRAVMFPILLTFALWHLASIIHYPWKPGICKETAELVVKLHTVGQWWGQHVQQQIKYFFCNNLRLQRS
jgi:hypothetical protein